MKRISVVAMLALAAVVTACGRNPEPEPPPPPPVLGPDTAAANAARREQARRDSIAAAEAARRAAEAAARSARETLTSMIFFDYDRSEIRSDMQDLMNRKAAILRANPNVTMRVEGHADERGTVEYNLALSLRRANAVREYLTGFGLDAGRFEVAALGEERPIAQGSNEAAWAQNRRAEFHITRGGNNLVPAR